ncbi:MAG: DUF4405 domain-containing protein [Sporolactobacillus sp.]
MKKNYIKFTIDIVMAIMFLLFFNTRVLGGLAYHEIAGLVFAVMFFTHVLLNLSWVKNVTIKLFDKNLPWKARGNYALNLLLLISMSFIIFSGIIISRVVFPNINLGNEEWFKSAHIAFSFLTLIVVGIHIGIHWHWVINVFKKIIQFKSKQRWVSYTARLAALIILIVGVYEIQQTGFFNQIASVNSVFSGSSSGKIEGHGSSGADGGQHAHFGNDGQKPDFENGQKPDLSNGTQFHGAGHDGGSANVLHVIATYATIMTVFVVSTYYIRKLTLRMRRRKWA